MKLQEQLDRLYKIQEDIRTVQESGLWQPLHEAKWYVIKLIQELEDTKTQRIKRNEIKLPTKSSEAGDEPNNF